MSHVSDEIVVTADIVTDRALDAHHVNNEMGIVTPSMCDCIKAHVGCLRAPCLHSMVSNLSRILCHVCEGCVTAFLWFFFMILPPTGYMCILVVATVGLPDSICSSVAIVVVFTTVFFTAGFIGFLTSSESPFQTWRPSKKQTVQRCSVGCLLFFFVHLAMLLHGYLRAGYCFDVVASVNALFAVVVFGLLQSTVITIRYCGYLPWFVLLSEEDAEHANFGVWIGVPWIGKVVNTKIFLFVLKFGAPTGAIVAVLLIALGFASPYFPDFIAGFVMFMMANLNAASLAMFFWWYLVQENKTMKCTFGWLWYMGMGVLTSTAVVLALKPYTENWTSIALVASIGLMLFVCVFIGVFLIPFNRWKASRQPGPFVELDVE